MKRVLLLPVLCLYAGLCLGQLETNSGILIVDPGATLRLEGEVANMNTATMVIDGTLEVEGDLENSGTFRVNSLGSLIFFGTGSSIYTVGNSTMNDLLLEKVSGNVALIGDLTIKNNLDFTGATNSKLLLNAANLTLEPSATITGSDAQSYILTDGAGALIKEVDASGIFEFPVGNVALRTPLTADFTGTSFSNATLSIRVNPVPDPNLPPDNMDYLSRYWEVDAANISGYQNTVTASYLNADVVGVQNRITGASHDGVEWSNENATGSGNTISVTVNGENATVTGFNTTALPVELAAFAAEKVGKTTAELTWSTASEQNTSHFSIERQTDASGWEILGRVEAAGTSQEARDYAHTDRAIPSSVRQQGTVYYRLNMVDVDGYQAYSPIRSVVFDEATIVLTVYPNPTANLISVVAEEEVVGLELFDPSGRLVLAGSTNQLDLQNLPVGSYTLKVETTTELVTTTIVRGE